MASTTFTDALNYFEQFLGYHFINANWLEEALHAGGPTIIGDRRITDANKSLATVGDAVLQLVLINQNFDAGLSRGMSDPDNDIVVM